MFFRDYSDSGVTGGLRETTEGFGVLATRTRILATV